MAKRRVVPGLALALLLLLASPDARAQTGPADPTTGATESHAPLMEALPWLEIGAIIGGAWLGSIIARRVISAGWFTLVGARLGAGMGAETAAALGLAGLGAGRALPPGPAGAVAPRLAIAQP